MPWVRPFKKKKNKNPREWGCSKKSPWGGPWTFPTCPKGTSCLSRGLRGCLSDTPRRVFGIISTTFSGKSVREPAPSSLPLLPLGKPCCCHGNREAGGGRTCQHTPHKHQGFPGNSGCARGQALQPGEASSSHPTPSTASPLPASLLRRRQQPDLPSPPPSHRTYLQSWLPPPALGGQKAASDPRPQLPRVAESWV